MKILVLLLIAFALTGGELADSPLQQRVLALKNALMPGEPGYFSATGLFSAKRLPQLRSRLEKLKKNSRGPKNG